MTYRGLSREVDLDGLPPPGSRFTLQELIGEGTYGEVYSARDTVTGKYIHDYALIVTETRIVRGRAVNRYQELERKGAYLITYSAA